MALKEKNREPRNTLALNGLPPALRLLVLVGMGMLWISCTGTQEEPTETLSSNEIGITDSLYNHEDFIEYSPEATVGATVYIPVYSHIYQRNARRTFNLTATLSIRNTDLISSIYISKVYYYDSDGNIVQKYLEEPLDLPPLSSVSYVVEEDDLRGGVGANFMVLWESENSVNQPVVEAVMISAAQNQGISFLSEGRIIHRLNTTSE